MPATTIDIGTYAVKVITADPEATPNVIKTVETRNTVGVAVPTDDLQTEKLSELVNNIIFDNKLPHTDVRLSMPESVISSKVITIPPLTDAELASAIGWQAEQHIPIPKEELSLQYKVLHRPDKNNKQDSMRVLLTGTRKAIVERYITLFTNMGVEPTFMETQMLSILRSLAIGPEEPPTMIVNLGATNMDIMVVANGEVQFIFSHAGVGDLLTKTIQQTLNLDIQQAEQYKRQYGLLADQMDGKVRQVILPTINNLVSEMQKAVRYFDNQAPQTALQRIVLTGGSTQLPGITAHFQEALSMEILLADPFAAATGATPAENHQVYAVCMGLLMRQT